MNKKDNDLRSVDDEDIRSVIEYTAQLASVVAPNARKLNGKVVQFIGTGPFNVHDLKSLLPVGVMARDPSRTIREPDFVVLGTGNFVEEQISSAVDARHVETSFLPQDGFLALVLFGYDWWWDAPELLNELKEWHPAMRYLHSLQSFQWPSTTAPESDQLVVSEGDFQEESDLHKMGYRITGKTRAERWRALTNAVPRLGLREVVETIANHIRMRKAQVGGVDRYSHAIDEWEHDLSMLRLTYYRGQARANFKWPSTGK